MPVSPPLPVNYQSPVISLPARTYHDAPEGKRMVHCEVDWSNMGGANNSVSFDLSNTGPNNFTQIVSINIDNTNCESDVRFYFTDTASQLTVPAFEQGVFEVFTNQTKFVLYTVGVPSGSDVTVFDVLNFLPPPVAIPRASPSTVSQQIVQAGVGLGTSNIHLATAPLIGTITSLNVIVSLDYTAVTSDGTISVVLSDDPSPPTPGAKTYWGGVLTVEQAGIRSVVMVDQSGLDIQYTSPNGLYLNLVNNVVGTGSELLSVNIGIVL